jgi:hypothetical protein
MIETIMLLIQSPWVSRQVVTTETAPFKKPKKLKLMNWIMVAMAVS